MPLNGTTPTYRRALLSKHLSCYRRIFFPFLPPLGRAFLAFLCSTTLLAFLICSLVLSSLLIFPIGFPPYRLPRPGRFPLPEEVVDGVEEFAAMASSLFLSCLALRS